MLRRKLVRLLYVSILILFTNCVGLYPIKNHLVRENNQDRWYTTPYESQNLFQLRIEQKTDFLPVGLDTIISNDKKQAIKLVSDFPYKKFRQLPEKQKSENNPYHLVVEETYLYLDDFNFEKESAKKSQFGYAFYFITYPAIDKHKRNTRKIKYYNDHEKLYTNVIRSIRVGYWILNTDGEIMLIFKNLDNKYAFYVGRSDDSKRDFVEINEISHPYNLSKRKITEIGLLKFIRNLNKGNLVKLPMKINMSLSGVEIKRIKSKIALIELNSVIDLEGRGLLFNRIPRSKVFHYEKVTSITDSLGNRVTFPLNVQGFSIGRTLKQKRNKTFKTKYEFFFDLSANNKTKQYLFNNKVSFIE